MPIRTRPSWSAPYLRAILLGLCRSLCFSSPFLPLLFITGLIINGELSSFPFAFNFSNFFCGVVLAGEVIGGSLALIAASFVMGSSELDLFVVLCPVRRGLFRGHVTGLEAVSLGFGEEDGCRAAVEVGEGADARLATT